VTESETLHHDARGYPITCGDFVTIRNLQQDQPTSGAALGVNRDRSLIKIRGFGSVITTILRKGKNLYVGYPIFSSLLVGEKVTV